MRPLVGGLIARELAFRLLYIRRPGAGIRRLCTPGRKVGGLFEKARGDVRICGGHCKLEKGCRLFRQIFLTRHNLVPATTHDYPSLPVRLRPAAESVPGEKYKSELKAGPVSGQARDRSRRHASRPEGFLVDETKPCAGSLTSSDRTARFPTRQGVAIRGILAIR